ncbi:unnamed protein product [Rotaria sp. Silwood1]|nr:unnamed protein product [Rotaria sp. Silwood1]CAF1600574.1 unnamed protein product [Rotaria sp. Silwood1]
MCFNYFDFYQLYETFFCLNQRFNKLILYDAKIHVDFGAIPNGKFLTFCFNLNQLTNTNKNYPLSIQADNEYQFNIFFEDDLFKDKFSKLKSLTINDIKLATLSNTIFDKKIKLYETLERLSLMEDISGESYEIEELCNNLISSKMKSLKYLNLNFEIHECECEHDVYKREDYVDLNFEELSIRKNSLNNLETVIIGYIPKNDCDFSTTRISFYSLAEKLLPCLPKLKNLIINSVYLDSYDDQYYQRKRMRVKIMENANPASMLRLELDQNEAISLEYLQLYFKEASGLKFQDVSTGEWNTVLFKNGHFLFNRDDANADTMFVVHRRVDTTLTQPKTTTLVTIPDRRNSTPPITTRRTCKAYIKLAADYLLGFWFANSSTPYEKLQ